MVINFPLGGKRDWRLPNKNELQSIVDYSRCGSSSNPLYDTVSSNYWSTTTCADAPGCAWFVGFGYGACVDGDSKSVNYYVRAVRAAEDEPPDTSPTITAATTTVVDPSCVGEELSGEHSEQTELLRYLRDNVLNATPEGQEIIKIYYELSPAIVKAMEKEAEFKSQMKEIVEGVVRLMGGVK